jgi:hypothetical protein
VVSSSYRRIALSRIHPAVFALCATGLALTVVSAGTLPALAAPAALTEISAAQQVDMTVLVVTDGGAAVSAIAQELTAEGVPHTAVNLNDPNRPVINGSFLSTTAGSGAPEARYQAVVLPNADPFGNTAEMTALATYEQQFGVRQVDADVYPNAAVGFGAPSYSGSLDGITGTVTAAGGSAAFPYLQGSVPFEDLNPGVAESYGYLATPLPDDPAAGTSFQGYVTGSAPAGTPGNPSGVLAGMYSSPGRQELELTFAYNFYQQQFQLLAHGIITWMTRGVHLGYDRNYFSLHFDDVLMPDSQWSQTGHCTPTEDCPAGVTTPDIRMTADDAAYAANWEQQNNFQFTMLFNGGGSAEQIAQTGSDPLTTALLADKNQFRWISHTYGHEFLGCVQDLTVIPWRCTVDQTGATQWVPGSDIVSQLNDNITWARDNGLPFNPAELVTGDYSGLAILPQQPQDNPNLAPALQQTGIGWLGSDASREPGPPRQVGPANTVPRHPMDIFYNVDTAAGEVSEYNWIYTTQADGGSGLCTQNPQTMTCISPLDPATGFQSYIVPAVSRLALRYVRQNDPRPFFVHQSNLTGDRIIYPVLGAILGAYRGEFAANAPAVNPGMTAAGAVMQEQQAWQAAQQAGSVAAWFVQYSPGTPKTVTVQAPGGLKVPLTMPAGSCVGPGLLGTCLLQPVFGQPYAAEQSAYMTASGGNPIVATLP